MKELKRTETIEKIIGYEANDGTHFNSKEECEKYEKTAFAVVHERFRKLVVKEMSEYTMFMDYAVGSDEYIYALIDIKTENDMNTYNHFVQFTNDSKIIDETYIGKRILVSLDYESEDWERRHIGIVGTMEDFKKGLEKIAEETFSVKGEINETK